jgi:hypothetical protein
MVSKAIFSKLTGSEHRMNTGSVWLGNNGSSFPGYIQKIHLTRTESIFPTLIRLGANKFQKEFNPETGKDDFIIGREALLLHLMIAS